MKSIGGVQPQHKKSIGLIVLFAFSLLIGLVPSARVHAADTVYNDADLVELEGDDGVTSLMSLPFSFDFYGQTFNDFAVSTNGVVSFDNPSDAYENNDLTADYGLDNNSIYAYWGDLDSYDLNTVYTRTMGTAPNRSFVIQWTNHGHHYPDTNKPFTTMQVILYETTNEIKLQYKYLSLGSLGTGETDTTIGISNGVDESDQYSYNTASVQTGDVVLFTPLSATDYDIDDTASDDEIMLGVPGQPGAFSLTSPSNGATGVSTLASLDWSSAADASLYRVYLSTDADFSSSAMVDDIDAGEDTNADAVLRPNTLYYWTVQAINDDTPNTGSRMSAVQTFTTGDVAPGVVEVGDCETLQNVDQVKGNIAKTIVLTQDIDCSDVENFEPIGMFDIWGSGDELFVGKFNGIFDGQGHTISNLTIDHPDEGLVGIFSTAKYATFQNLTIESGSILGNDTVGALAGSVEDTTVRDVHTSANVEDDSFGTTGGLIGYVESTLNGETMYLENLSSTGSVTATSDAGGLFGELIVSGGTIQMARSYATGTVSQRSGATDDNFGGLVGDVETVVEDGSDGAIVIEDSYAQGDVTADGPSVGGLLGDTYVATDDDTGADSSSLTIRRSYASGDVQGDNVVGGLIGDMEAFSEAQESYVIEDSFATGAVTIGLGTSLGGFIGYDEADTISGDLLATMSNNHFDDNNGAIDCNAGLALLTNCTGLDEAAQSDYFMQSSNAPLDTWDFDAVWREESGGYPVLRHQAESLASAEDGTPITLTQLGCDAITETSASREADLSMQDPAYSYPVGLVGFTLDGCSVGGDAWVRATFTGDYTPSDITVRKYNPTNDSFTILTEANADLQKQTTTLNSQPAIEILYRVTDGGDFDADGTANGTIVDPVGVSELILSAPNTGFKRIR